MKSEPHPESPVSMLSVEPTPPAIEAPERRGAANVAYEAWISMIPGEFERPHIGDAFEAGYLAASSGEREKALEEAAKVAKSRAEVWRGHLTDGSSCAMSLMEECEDIADAIRALAPTPATVEEPKV